MGNYLTCTQGEPDKFEAFVTSPGKQSGKESVASLSEALRDSAMSLRDVTLSHLEVSRFDQSLLTGHESRLTLKVKNGNVRNRTIEITAGGMVGGHRKVSDGQTFFGTRKKSAPDSAGYKSVLNDFIIPNVSQKNIKKGT